MNSKTKIVVLHLKELIYTGIFAALGILFIILLIIMFLPRNKDKDSNITPPANSYMPGVYTTSLILNDNVVDIEVAVDASSINDIRMVNLDDAVTAMYPLIEPTFEDLVSQICESQSLDGLTYSDDNKYTSLVLLDAIKASLQKAEAAAASDNQAVELED